MDQTSQMYHSWRSSFIDYALSTGNRDLFNKMIGPLWKEEVFKRRSRVKRELLWASMRDVNKNSHI